MNPVMCDKCNIPMIRTETHDYATLSYEWNKETGVYDEIDEDFGGNLQVSFSCPGCGEEVDA